MRVLLRRGYERIEFESDWFCTLLRGFVFQTKRSITHIILCFQIKVMDVNFFIVIMPKSLKQQTTLSSEIHTSTWILKSPPKDDQAISAANCTGLWSTHVVLNSTDI